MQHTFPDDDSPLRRCTACDTEWHYAHAAPCSVVIEADIVNTRSHDQFLDGLLIVAPARDRDRVLLSMSALPTSYLREATCEASVDAILDTLALHGWTFAGATAVEHQSLAPLRALAVLQGIGEAERMSVGADAWATSPQGATQLLRLLVDLVEGAIAIDTDDPRVMLASRLLRDAAELHGTQPIGTERTVPIADADATQLLNRYLQHVRRRPKA